jgi:L-alanine-DL-glutamate epimerase-like enolase superfamily enzyme
VARIEGVALHRRTIDLRRPFVTAIRTAHSIDVLLVEVFDSDGRSGWGEAPTSWRVTGESIESVSAAVLGPLIEAVKGHSSEDPAATSTALARAVALNSSARMALDCALYDLAARAADVPLFHYLGGSSDEVRTDMTLSAVVEGSETDALCRTAREFIDAGFGALKVKVGAGGDDVRTLTRVRDVAGPDVQLRIDANQGWSREEAIRVISTLEDAGVGIEFAEQPVDRDDIDALAFVTAHVQTPIVADEAVWNRRDLREVIKTHAADMINVKLAKTGGLREALGLISLARECDVLSIVGCMAESHVGIAAAAALASATEASRSHAPSHDLDGGLLLVRSPVVGGVTYDGERVLLSRRPGTGIVGLADT